ncbi:MAG: hypothetical protein DRP60_07245 [Spirochaetes bacterium]|nr:MAG: hypothetical protein DRP60_07245 [Spirochaetota bacterium]
MRYVIDASTAVRWYLDSLSHPYADEVLKKVLIQPELFAVPELFTYEVLSVLYRIHPDASRIYEKDVNRLLRSGILRYPMTDHIFGRAERFIACGLTGYDACYAALAEELEASWLTFDGKACRMLMGKGDVLPDSEEPSLAVDLNRQQPFPA